MSIPLHPTEVQLRKLYPYRIDVTDCAKEPLHHINVVQAEIAVLAIDPSDWHIRYVSENAEELLGHSWNQLLDSPIEDHLPEDAVASLRRGHERGDFEPGNPLLAHFEIKGETVARNLVMHRAHEFIIIEVEPVIEEFRSLAFQRRITRAIRQIQEYSDFETLFTHAARSIRELTGYDRVMVYRFDEEQNGEVIAESRREDLEPFLGLRYPATDIPRQARELYVQARVRQLADVQRDPVLLHRSNSVSSWQPLDLSLAAGRGVSPVHREYLKNMGVTASMSIAIVLEGKLWGLFAMHHHEPRFLDFELRGFLKFAGQVFSGHLAVRAASEYRRRVLEVKMSRSVLSSRLKTDGPLAQDLLEGRPSLMDLIDGCTGVALRVEDELHLRGQTPLARVVEGWVAQMAKENNDLLLFHTDRLVEEFPPASATGDRVAGALLVWLDRSKSEYVVWFRPEIIRSITWGGNPRKNLVPTTDGQLRLSPRESFQRYVEQVRGRSERWTQFDEDSALSLRTHLKDVMLQRYQSYRAENNQLTAAYKEMETFSYTVSHDLRAPLRGIAGFAEALLEDYGDKLDDAGREMLHLIQSNTGRMNVLLSELLEVSQVGVSEMNFGELHIAHLAEQNFLELMPNYRRQGVRLKVQPNIPTGYGDERLVKVLLTNLISNAIKYSIDQPEAVIEIGAVASDEVPSGKLFYVKDNGMGFEQQHADKVFEMFMRLQEDERIDGCGIGLALCKRVVDRHRGTIHAVSEPGEGATFYFSLARP